MSAETILDECKALIKERGEKYGDFEQGMTSLTKFLDELGLHALCYTDTPKILFLLKFSRMRASKMKHRDSCMDAINYLSEYIHLMDMKEGWQ